MHRAGGVIGVATLLALLAADGQATALDHAVRECRFKPARQHVIAADARAEVYSGPGALKDGCDQPEPPGAVKVYGRLRAHDRAFLLGAAPWGATESVGGVDHDLRTGQVLRSAPVATPVPFV